MREVLQNPRYHVYKFLRKIVATPRDFCYPDTMRIEYGSEKEIKEGLLRIIGGHLDLSSYKVFIFGSRAGTKGDEHSDIDLGIQGPQKIPLGVLATIREEIEELPFLYKIDVVDFADASEEFKSIALRHVEYLGA